MSLCRSVIFISALLLAATLLQAETILKGVVIGEDGQALPMVMVKATGRVGKLYHARTTKDGTFSVIPEAEDTVLKVKFSRLGYDAVTMEASRPFEPLTVKMHRSAVALKEVTVEAPSVRVKGDTIAYNLADFAGKGDVTLQDALKKVPGVEVAGNGGIKYNGKSISNFYINGVDLLGGKYNIATMSIPHSYVSTVEVLNNHEDLKIERRVFNDNVALNVKLKPKAMFKPMGKYEATAGYGEHLLGELSGAGMMFTDNFQTILTLKGGNVREFAAKDDISHYSRDNTSGKSYLEKILGSQSASTPPIGRDRWISPIDASASLNFINKLTADASLRTNLAYTYEHSEYDFSETATYFGGDADVSVNRRTSPEASAHKPSLEMEYKLNSDKRYIRNSFYAKAAFSDGSVPVVSNKADISQNRKLKTFSVSDFFDLSLSHGKMMWYYSSSFQFRGSPVGKVAVEKDEQEKASFLQSARSYSFITKHNFSGRIELRRSRISLPLTLMFSHDRVHTDLANHGFGDGAFTNAINSLKGTELQLAFSPNYEYASAYNRFVFRAGVPVSLEIHNWKNQGSEPAADNKPRVEVSPSLYMNYVASAKSTFRATMNLDNTYGDILSVLTAPVMTDYMSMQLRSGILSHSRTLNTLIHYGFKSPMTMWNAHVDIGFTKGWNNLLSRQYVSSGLIAVTDYLAPNSYDSFSARCGLQKNIRTLKTVLAVDASWNWSRRHTEQNDVLVKYYGNTFTVTPRISSNPFGWFELNYRLNLSVNATRYLDVRHSYTSQVHDVGLNFYPAECLELNLKSDISRKEISVGRYKTMSLFDAGAVYKYKSMRFGLKLRNILNTRSYSYTVLNGLDNYSYSYSLRGRELLLSISFIK